MGGLKPTPAETGGRQGTLWKGSSQGGSWSTQRQLYSSILIMDKYGSLWMNDLMASSAPRTHLCVEVCVASFGWVFVPHGRHPAGLAALGEGADLKDPQHTATHTQLILQDEAVLRA